MAATLHLQEVMEGIPLGRHLDVAVLPHFDAAAPPPAHEFRPLGRHWIALGSVSGAVWLRLDVRNPSNRIIAWKLSLEIPFPERMQLYALHEGAVPAARAPSYLPFPTFALTTPAYAEQRYLVRIDMRGLHSYPVVAWTEGEFSAQRHRGAMQVALLVGAFALTAFFLLAIGASLRDPQALWYVTIMIASVARLLLNTGHLNLLPPEWHAAGQRLAYPIHGSIVVAILLVSMSHFPSVWGGRRLASILRLELTIHSAFLIAIAMGAIQLAGPATVFTAGLIFPTLTLAGTMILVRAWRERRSVLHCSLYALAILLLMPIAYTVTLINSGYIEPDHAPRLYFFPLWPLAASFLFSMSYTAQVSELQRARTRAQQDLLAARESHILMLETEVELRTGAYRQEKEQAERSSQARLELLRIVSHDLRSPLSGVLLAVARIHDEIGAQHARTLEMITRTITLLNKRIETLLTFEDARLLRAPALAVRANLRRLIEEHCQGLIPIAEEKRIVVEYAIPTTAWVEADPFLLGAVIGNLVGNAIKFCTAGDRIRIDIDEDGEITVSDTGPGIAALASRDPIELTTIPRRPGSAGELGYGLGLRACQMFMDAQQGTIRCSSSPASGTCFSIRVSGGRHTPSEREHMPPRRESAPSSANISSAIH